MFPKYPDGICDVEEQERYKIRLTQHAQEAGKSIEEYVRDSRYNYVLLSNADQPEHWFNNDLCPEDPEFDETDWVVYGSREEAEDERQLLISEKDYGHRVVTERYFLRMKGLLLPDGTVLAK